MTSRGVTSPYPTVVTVWIAHHIPTHTFVYSRWSKTLIRTPERTTTLAVARTMVPAAPRTDGGSRRNFVIRRSSRLTRATPADVTPGGGGRYSGCGQVFEAVQVWSPEVQV